MKIISPMVGKGSGKLGDTIVASIAGFTIARQYNPNVTNPNTSAQQNTRARFKLLSQLSSVFSANLAIRKEGLTSARNIFTSINFDKTSFNGDEALVDLNQIQITKSAKYMTDFEADRTSGTKLEVSLLADSSTSFDRVVYCAYIMNEMGELLELGSIVVTDPGQGGVFAGELPYTADSIVVYAYGIHDVSSAMHVKFGNIQAPSADAVARLITSSAENMAGVLLTRTKGLTMVEGVNEAASTFEPIVVSTLTMGSTSIKSTETSPVVVTRNEQGYAELVGAYTPADAHSVVARLYRREGEGAWEPRASLPGVNGSITGSFYILPEYLYKFEILQQGIKVYESAVFRASNE
jgi:hypothetical protein